VRFGTAGWDYPDWNGVVFPKPRPKTFDPLEYLARYFGTIEINNTFYRPAAAAVAKKWVERVAAQPDFRFTAKLWKRFTHERASAWSKADVAAARAGLDVLREAGRLGALLLQFPWSFKNEEASQEWLRDLFRAFGHLPLVLEVRHVSWSEPSVIEWLAESGVGLVNIDQPQFAKSIKPGALVTAPVGYVRLHGRNYKEWFRKSAGRNERYDYLYTSDELRPWAARVKDIAAQAKETYAVTNNHRLGKAPANAAMLESLVTGKKVDVPPLLLGPYGEELAPFTRGNPQTVGARSTTNVRSSRPSPPRAGLAKRDRRIASWVSCAVTIAAFLGRRSSAGPLPSGRTIFSITGTAPSSSPLAPRAEHVDFDRRSLPGITAVLGSTIAIWQLLERFVRLSEIAVGCGPAPLPCTCHVGRNTEERAAVASSGRSRFRARPLKTEAARHCTCVRLTPASTLVR
jgi:uncharacterized protein YecE (DUF72 family)